MEAIPTCNSGVVTGVPCPAQRTRTLPKQSDTDQRSILRVRDYLWGDRAAVHSFYDDFPDHSANDYSKHKVPHYLGTHGRSRVGQALLSMTINTPEDSVMMFGVQVLRSENIAEMNDQRGSNPRHGYITAGVSLCGENQSERLAAEDE